MDIVSLARSVIGKAEFVRGLDISHAPWKCDCSSFTKWLYAHSGIWIPRLTVEQCICGKPVSLTEARAGDLIFTLGSKYNFYPPYMPNGVGHVGIMTHERTVISCMWCHGVVELPLDEFLKKREFRAVRRIL
jgi:cell wall-associated NlpC family hydrolase